MSSRQDARAASADGVDIAYTHAGSGPISLLFIHGGLANRTFWEPQLAALAGVFRMAALDLAGHGESGRNRERWTIGAFAGDVCAVADAMPRRLLHVMQSARASCAKLAPAAFRLTCNGFTAPS